MSSQTNYQLTTLSENKLEKKRRSFSQIVKNPAFLFLLPTIIVFVLLGVYPTVSAIWTSLLSYNLTEPSNVGFVFLQNYITIFKDGRFWIALWHSAQFVVTGVGLSFVIGLFIAMLLNKITRFKTFYQIGFLIPMVISPTVAAYNFKFMYNYNFGIFNSLLEKVGLERIDFLGNSATALWATVVIDIWQWTPLVILILLAGLETLPKEPYEAALIDGASPLKTFLSITIPLLKPFIIIAILIRLMDSLKVYEYIQLVTASGPGTSSETLNTYLATVGFNWFEMGSASALGLIALNITSLLSLFLVKKTNMFKAGEEH
jgi:multiple sugar transport system permease protein